MIRISSKREGFRRCGVAHSMRPVDYGDDFWSDKQLAILKDEPMLIVDVVEGKAEGSAKPNAKETIKLIAEATTVEQLVGFADGEDRKTVLEAIESKRKELEG